MDDWKIIWNSFCDEVAESVQKNNLEKVFEEDIARDFFTTLGWNRFKKELKEQYSVKFATATHRADFALFTLGKETPEVIIELKRPKKKKEEKDANQLIDYMRQEACSYGVLLLGQKLEIYYIDYSTPKHEATLVETIKYQHDNEAAHQFMEVLNRGEYSSAKMLEYCHKRVKVNKSVEYWCSNEMTDYSKYPYSRMLQYIERRSLELGRKNHIDYILSMEKAETMEKLIDIYNHAFQYLAILFFGTRKVPHGWYIVETWGYKNDYLLEELNWCLNENILRWLKRQESPSNEQTLSALSNLHKSKNIVTIQNEILKISTPQADNGVKTLSYIRNKQYDMRRPKSNYRYNKNDYLYCSGYLAAHGHIFDIIEITCGKDLGISYDNVAIEYKKEVELEEKRKEDERIELEKEKRKILIRKITIGVLIIPIAILISYIMHEVGLIGIIIIIGFIGAIPKVFLTGHL